MKKPLVSVLMPAFNGERFIQQAIESVLDQSYSHWELIIVDDGSTDSTPDIITAIRDPRIRYKYQENRGQAAALNRGLDLAQGDFITTLDVDDWYTPNSLNDRVLYLEEHSDHDVVYGNGFYCDTNGEPLMRFSEFRIGNVVGDVYEVLIESPFFNTGGNVMVRKRVFDRYEIDYDESIFWCQDWDLLIRIAEHAAFGYIDTRLLWYRLSEGNMTMSPLFEERRLKSLIQMKYKVVNSPKFSQVTTTGQFNFYNSFLTYYLQGRNDDQINTINTEQFNNLPRKQRAILIRRVAIDYLMRARNPELAKRWSKMAWSSYPLNLKTMLTILLIHVNSNFATEVLSMWRITNSDKEEFLHPFQMASESR